MDELLEKELFILKDYSAKLDGSFDYKDAYDEEAELLGKRIRNSCIILRFCLIVGNLILMIFILF